MSARSQAAVARSAGADRTVAAVLGLLTLTGGAAVLLAGTGVGGQARAGRPVLDPVAVGWISANRSLTLAVAILAGLLLFALGLGWVLRSIRPERKPDVVLEHSPTRGLTVTSEALADAVRADAETVTGVDRARVRLVGDPDRPALRLMLWLREGAELRTVWDELDSQVLARARATLGVDTLPAAVRVELDAARRQRVQ